MDPCLFLPSEFVPEDSCRGRIDPPVSPCCLASRLCWWECLWSKEYLCTARDKGHMCPCLPGVSLMRIFVFFGETMYLMGKHRGEQISSDLQIIWLLYVNNTFILSPCEINKLVLTLSIWRCKLPISTRSTRSTWIYHGRFFFFFLTSSSFASKTKNCANPFICFPLSFIYLLSVDVLESACTSRAKNRLPYGQRVFIHLEKTGFSLPPRPHCSSRVCLFSRSPLALGST